MPGMEMVMVQVVENRADIAGRIQAMRADPERPDYRIVTIEVHSAAPVEGYANMFTSAAGTRLEILVAADQSGVTSITDGVLTVELGTERSTGDIGVKWGSWSSTTDAESATPVVFYVPFLNDPTDPASAVETLSFDKDVTTFGVEVEPNVFIPPHNIRADFYDRSGALVGSIERLLGGDSSARLFAANATAGDSFAKVVLSMEFDPGVDTLKDFAFAQVRYAGVSQVVPEPSSLAMLLGAGMVGLIAFSTRRRRSNAA